ncbi:type II toxin-antitoxin system RelE/ParE family toxin [Acidisoma sp.]|uniref:type II toxin-antitoxin system RelE/ParE family toxin n=1 Tax=Acidisoma sp. TaxID=1872115 RepID=UPI003B0098EA
MISLSREAEAQVDSLVEHFETNGRLEAAVNLFRALERAKDRIATAPDAGLPAPRPYRAFQRPGRRWIIEGRYCVSYRLTSPPVISGGFYVTADIPHRI